MTKSLVALVGMKHRGTEALVASLPAGEVVRLVPEPTNKFDRDAVMVWARGEHVGYLKASQIKGLSRRIQEKGDPWALARPIGALSEFGGVVTTHMTFKGILSIDGGKWPLVEIEEDR